jgi:hypothetical protein
MEGIKMKRRFNHNQKIINEIFGGQLTLTSLLNEREEGFVKKVKNAVVKKINKVKDNRGLAKAYKENPINDVDVEEFAKETVEGDDYLKANDEEIDAIADKIIDKKLKGEEVQSVSNKQSSSKEGGLEYKKGGGGYEYGYDSSTGELYITKSPKSKASREKPSTVSKNKQEKAYNAILKDVYGISPDNTGKSDTTSNTDEPDNLSKEDLTASFKPLWKIASREGSAWKGKLDKENIAKHILPLEGDKFEAKFYPDVSPEDIDGYKIVFKIGNYKDVSNIDQATISVVEKGKYMNYGRGMNSLVDPLKKDGLKLVDLMNSTLKDPVIEAKRYTLSPKELFRIAVYCIVVKHNAVSDVVLSESFSKFNGMVLGESRASLYRKRYHGRY